MCAYLLRVVLVTATAYPALGNQLSPITTASQWIAAPVELLRDSGDNYLKALAANSLNDSDGFTFYVEENGNYYIDPEDDGIIDDPAGTYVKTTCLKGAGRYISQIRTWTEGDPSPVIRSEVWLELSLQWPGTVPCIYTVRTIA